MLNLILANLWKGSILVITSLTTQADTGQTLQKNWEENNHFQNYWFPFGLSPLLRNFLYVNSCLCGFDQFRPHPSVAWAKLSLLTHQIPAALSPNQEHTLSIALSDLVNWQTWPTALSLGCEYVFDLLIFSHIWTNIKRLLSYSKRVENMASCLHVS